MFQRTSVGVCARLHNAVVHAADVEEEKHEDQQVVNQPKKAEKGLGQHVYGTNQVDARDHDAQHQLGHEQLAETAHLPQVGQQVPYQHRHIEDHLQDLEINHLV